MKETQVKFDLRPLSYRKLDSSKSEIRLLELQPAQDINDIPVCRLVHLPLTEDLEILRPQFIAISSLLGDPGETENIIVNNARVVVPATIGQALRHVREVFLQLPDDSSSCSEEIQRVRSQVVTPAETSPNWLGHQLRRVRSIISDTGLRRTRQHDAQPVLRIWLDYLCINRRNSQERKEQLKHMGMVYRQANMVIGWLGPKAPGSDTAVWVMRDIEEAFPPQFGTQRDRDLHPENYAPKHEWMRRIKYIWADLERGPYYPALMDLVERPYLNRGWILDEISMARSPAFLLGDTVVSWKQVLLLNRMTEELRDHESDMFPSDMRHLIHTWPLNTTYTLDREYQSRHMAQESELGMPARKRAKSHMTESSEIASS